MCKEHNEALTQRQSRKRKSTAPSSARGTREIEKIAKKQKSAEVVAATARQETAPTHVKKPTPPRTKTPPPRQATPPPRQQTPPPRQPSPPKSSSPPPNPPSPPHVIPSSTLAIEPQAQIVTEQPAQVEQEHHAPIPSAQKNYSSAQTLNEGEDAKVDITTVSRQDAAEGASSGD